VTSTEKAYFQSNADVKSRRLDSGGIVSAPGDGEPCKAIRVTCDLASAASVRVRIPGLHNSGEYATLAAGESDVFILKNLANGLNGEIDIVYLSTASGTATVRYYVVA